MPKSDPLLTEELRLKAQNKSLQSDLDNAVSELEDAKAQIAQLDQDLKNCRTTNKIIQARLDQAQAALASRNPIKKEQN